MVDAADWPHDRREEFRLMQAVQNQTLTPELGVEVQHAVRRLGEFKAWLNGQGIRATFRTPDDLGRQVAHALHEWRQRHPDFDRAEAPRTDDKSAVAAYRRELIKSCQYLPLRGIDVESADPTSDAARLELAKVYVTLNVTTQVEIQKTSAPPPKAWWRRFLGHIGVAALEAAVGKAPDLRGGRKETRPLGALEAIATNPRDDRKY